ncbi:hypothetical protein SLA2020_406990 [Shorea laevis]
MHNIQPLTLHFPQASLHHWINPTYPSPSISFNPRLRLSAFHSLSNTLFSSLHLSDMQDDTSNPSLAAVALETHPYAKKKIRGNGWEWKFHLGLAVLRSDNFKLLKAFAIANFRLPN